MARKTELKDFVRDLMNQAPNVTNGPTVLLELECARTGERRVERIRLDWWEDDDFRSGFEAIRGDDGLVLVGSKITRPFIGYACL
jgi:hypothetical protein